MRGISLTLTTLGCPICGAIVYVEFMGEGEGHRYAGLPTDNRTIHAEWHERTGTS